MPRLEPAVVSVVTDLDRGLRALGVPFAVVGALVPELLLNARPTRMTNDADVTVVVDSLAEFEQLEDRLEEFGFRRTEVSHRLRHRSGGRADILPFSHALAPGGRLELQEGRVLNMAGFEQVVPSAVNAVVEGGLALPVVPLPLYALLKLVAFSDRKEPRDLAGVFHCLQHYLEDDDRRYGAEHEGRGVPFEYTGAYLLGVDGLPFFSAQVSEAVRAVLDRFAHPDSDVISVVAHERGRVAIEEEDRIEVFEHFSWYRRGLGF
jgi:predicted nucleotidyltransferase